MRVAQNSLGPVERGTVRLRAQARRQRLRRRGVGRHALYESTISGDGGGRRGLVKKSAVLTRVEGGTGATQGDKPATGARRVARATRERS